MNYRNRIRWLSLLVCAGRLLGMTSRADLWCTAYFPGYDNSMVPADIDFSVVTHVVHFSVLPIADGSLDSDINGITPANSTDIITRAHAANRKALICVGGEGSSFQSPTSDTYITNFVSNLTNFMASRGYDGVDIDWEPFADSDGTQFTNLVTKLRTALNAFNPHRLLTVAMPSPLPWQPSALPSIMASVSDQFDQINLQTYDLSGPYPGWITWHNSAMFDSGHTLPGGETVPSVDGVMTRFITNGIPAGKLGLGMTFHGQLWTGVALPLQSWTTAPTMVPITYNDILSNYSANAHYWANDAQAPYISITNANPANDIFISYDDERACQSKVSYARNHGLGGLIIWQLKQDHRANQVDPLLNAVKQALATPGTITAQQSGQNLNLSFTSAPLGSYRVQWKSNLTDAVWNTLVVTNMTNTGGVIQVTDPEVLGQARRFYRVRTPQ